MSKVKLLFEKYTMWTHTANFFLNQLNTLSGRFLSNSSPYLDGGAFFNQTISFFVFVFVFVFLSLSHVLVVLLSFSFSNCLVLILYSYFSMSLSFALALFFLFSFFLFLKLHSALFFPGHASVCLNGTSQLKKNS